MKRFSVLNVAILAFLLFPQASYAEDIDDVLSVIEELENRELEGNNAPDEAVDERNEELDDLDVRQSCDGLCNPTVPCDCIVDWCLPDSCLTARDINEDYKRDQNGQSKKFIGILRFIRFCRRGFFRRNRICRFRGKK